jgi:homopolymeric O-antigen transport system permease protein
MWAYRRLLPFFGLTFVRKSYQRTKLGVLWIPLRPALGVGARVLIFGGLLGVPSGGVPYLIFFLVGMAAWQFFYRALYWATRSVELSRRFLTRIYLPRLLIMLSTVIPSLVELGLYLVMLLIAVVYYVFADGTTHLHLGVETLLSVAAIVLLLLLAFSIGLWTSVFGAQSRDMRFTLSHVLSFWYLLSPVIYPLSLVPSGFRTLAQLNPVTAPLEMMRYGLIGNGDIEPTGLAITLGSILVVGTSGLWFFSRSESAALDAL